MESYEIQNMTSEFKYKFSIIMAVYNVEQFLREAIDSVIEQDIGFEQNVQLILVNDGSTDSSGNICDEYKEKYFDNIIVIHKGNGGVSSARNEGLKFAEGRYINFMDPDDKISKNTLESVFSFFIKNEDIIDIVAIPMMFFDGLSGKHWLNYKFDKGTRIIDLNKEYNAILMSASTSFFTYKRKKDITFDTKLIIAEDAKVVLTLLLNKMKFGVVANCSYMYRKRTVGNSSAMQSCRLKKEWYLDFFKYFVDWVVNYYMFYLGYIPKFVQYILAYDFQGRLKNDGAMEQTLKEDEINYYKNKLYDSLKLISDKIIMEQKMIWTEHKCFMLEKKHGHLPRLDIYKNDIKLAYGNTEICCLSNNSLYIDFINIRNNKLKIEGYSIILGFQEDEPIDMYLSINDKYKKCIKTDRNVNKYTLNEMLARGIGFKIEIELDNNIETYKIGFFCKIRECLIERKNIRFGKFCPIGNEYKSSYYYKKGRVLFYNKPQLYLSKCGKKGLIKYEKEFLKELWKSGKSSDKKAFYVRTLVHILKPFLRKEIWLISDRMNKAGDNGEALLRYTKQRKIRSEKFYFVLDEKSPDYTKISKIGKAVKYLSYKNKILHLLSSKIISSQADEFIINPFQEYFKPYRDILCEKYFIFLQHGVTKDDLSEWLNKYNKNIKMFVTVSEPEYKSILQYNYYYSNKEVKLIGFPRYDLLYSNEKNYITIMPTWRKYLAQGLSSNTGVWELSNEFLSSDYFNFYNSLINSEKLIKATDKYGYKLQFMPHPNVIPYIDKFTKNKDVKFLNLDCDYKDIFAESNLIITDYSSVAFDFAYMFKPVLYCQFDKEEFFSGGHAYKKGYFDYENDGFGEVEYTVDSLVNRIIEYMSNNCKLKDKYRKRIDNFFYFHDRNNCQRVYETIKLLK